jgi:hypothetical protein
MVADPTDNLEVVEQQKADLMWVINAKLTLVDGRYHQLVQKERRENKVDIVKIRQESGKKGGLAKAKQQSSKESDSDLYLYLYIIIYGVSYQLGEDQSRLPMLLGLKMPKT